MPAVRIRWSATSGRAGPYRVKTLHSSLIAALCLLLTATPLSAQPASRQVEYQIKAGYIYNFAKFVEWPPPPLPDGANFRVGVLVDENAYTVIAETLRGRLIGDHPLEVVLLKLDTDASNCRVVFIPRSVGITPRQFHAAQPAARVLLVGEKDGFAASGGEIGFVPRGDNLRYQVNLAAAEHAGLRLSARLASLAEIVHVPSL